MKKVILLGSGGHAKCVIDSMRLAGKYQPYCVLDIKERVGDKILGVEVVGSDSDLPVFIRRGIGLCFVALGSTGDPSRRIMLWQLALKAGFKFPTIIHPSSSVSSDSDIGHGVYIGPGAVVNAGAVIGDGCIINSCAVVEHDCRIGQFVHLAPGAVLSGGVIIGDRVHLGTGCSVTHGVEIGEDSIVGTGCVVIRNITSHAVCVGNPAKKIKRKLSPKANLIPQIQ